MSLDPSISFLLLGASVDPQMHRAPSVCCLGIGAQGVALIGLRLARIVPLDIVFNDCRNAGRTVASGNESPGPYFMT